MASPRAAQPQVMYRTADMPPPYNVRVWLAWPGWLGEGVRLMAVSRAGSKCERWVTWQQSRVQILPPASVRDAKGNVDAGYERPVLWAPLKPEAWRAALPDSVKTIEAGRMWSARQAFDATAAAAEMEDARRNAALNERDTRTGTPARQWWRDAALLTYCTPGHITKREAEGRVMRALASDPFARWGAGTGLHAGRGLLDWMDEDDVRAAAERTDHAASDIAALFKALPQDHRDYGTAMAWFAATCRFSPLSRRAYTAHPVLLLAADDRAFSWREMADVLRLTRQGAHQAFGAAIEDIWIIANGFQHAGRARRIAALEELSARVRKYRRER